MLSLEFLGFSLVLNDNHWLVISSGFNLERPKFAISLDGLVSKLSTDESLGIEDGVERVSGSLILGGISDESFLVSEGNVGWGGVETLVVCDDFNLVVHPNSDAGVGGSEIDSDGDFNFLFSIHLSMFECVFKF